MGAPAPSTRQPPTPAAPAPLANSAPAAPPAPLTRAFPLPVPRWVGRATRTLRGQFLLLGVLILALCLIQAYVMTRTFAQAQADLTTITRSSVPSIEAAQAMAQTLEELDAQAAIYLLSADQPTPQPCVLIGGETPAPLPAHDCAALNLDAGILRFNRQLYSAAHNVTYDGEHTAIERITAAFQEYVAHLTVMRYEYEAAVVASDPADPGMQRAIMAYQNARTVLYEQPTRQPVQGGVALTSLPESQIPACLTSEWGGKTGQEWPNGPLRLTLSCLISLNQRPLRDAQQRAQDTLNLGWYLAVVVGLPLGVLLIFTTLRMSYVSRRVINPGLTLALLVGLVLSFTTQAALSTLYSSFDKMVSVAYSGSYGAAVLKQQAAAAHNSHTRWLLAQYADDAAQADKATEEWNTMVRFVQMGIDTPSASEGVDYQGQSEQDALQTSWTAYSTLRTTIISAAEDDLGAVKQESIGALTTAFANFTANVERLGEQHHAHYQAYERSMAHTLERYRLYSLLFFPLVGLLALWGIALRLRDF